MSAKKSTQDRGRADGEDEKNGKRSENRGKLAIFSQLYIDLLGSLIPGLFTIMLGGLLLFLTLNGVYTILFDSRLSAGEHEDPNASEGGSLLFLTLDGVGAILFDSRPIADEHEDTDAGKDGGPDADEQKAEDSPFGSGVPWGDLHYEIAAVVIVTAYVVGVTFYRQDPQWPDKLSALRVWMKASKEDRRRLAAQGKHDNGKSSNGDHGGALEVVRWINRCVHLPFAWLAPKRYMALYEIDAEFPYTHLRCYLARRGLGHLTAYVPWCPKDIPSKAESTDRRTKEFINIIKIRLLALAPHLSREVIRNEAHVRLATSVWYVATNLLYVTFGCLAAIIITVGIVNNTSHVGLGLDLDFVNHGCDPIILLHAGFEPILANVLVMILCVLMSLKLRNCIHHMRVREVVYVLETLHVATTIERVFKLDTLTDNASLAKTKCPCS